MMATLARRVGLVEIQDLQGNLRSTILATKPLKRSYVVQWFGQRIVQSNPSNQHALVVRAALPASPERAGQAGEGSLATPSALARRVKPGPLEKRAPQKKMADLEREAVRATPRS
jgi:hypothetical protein